MKRKEISRKSWLVEIIKYNDGTAEIHKVNTGFTAYELLGIAEFNRVDIIEQLRGNIKPDIIKREVVDDGTYKENK
jgi:hypothetical protein